MNKDISTDIKQTAVISFDDEMFKNATDKEREAAMCDLFSALSNAITKGGCSVNIDDPNRIVVTKK